MGFNKFLLTISFTTVLLADNTHNIYLTYVVQIGLKQAKKEWFACSKHSSNTNDVHLSVLCFCCTD